MSIKHWPKGDQPREKLINKGPAALTDAELLAIFLRTGISGKSALAIARDVLNQYGSIRRLLQLPLDSFCKLPGMGMAKYAQLQAALELSRRYLLDEAVSAGDFKQLRALEDFLLIKLGCRSQEVFAVLFFTAKCQFIAYDELFFGSITGAAVYPREVVKKALAYNAAAIVIAHNHPSGDPTPSQADWQLTRHLERALELLEIKLLQHVVVGHTTCQCLI